MTVLPALHRGIVAVQVTQISARAAPALEFRNRRRASHHRRGPGLDHRAERHAVRARSGHRPGAAAGSDRHASQPFLHAEHGRWPPAGRLRGQRCRLRRASPWRRDDPGRRPGAAHGLPGLFGTRGFGTRGAHPSPAARHRRDRPGRSGGDRRAWLVRSGGDGKAAARQSAPVLRTGMTSGTAFWLAPRSWLGRAEHGRRCLERPARARARARAPRGRRRACARPASRAPRPGHRPGPARSAAGSAPW